MKDRLFYIGIVIMVIVLIALSVVAVQYSKHQDTKEARDAYALCLETNKVRTGLNTDKQIIRDILQDSINSAEAQLADPEVVASYPPQVVEQARENIIKVKKNKDRIKSVELRDCDSIKP